MKHIYEYYKDWSGEHHTTNSNKQVHDSAEMTDFAEYVYKEKSEPLKNMLNNILATVENYLQNKQVYLKKEITNSDFKTIAESGKVHNIGKVDLTRISNEKVAFTIVVNGVETTMYEYKSDLELFAWVKTNFIPVSELVERWMS